jgi:hypothetical protein
MCFFIIYLFPVVRASHAEDPRAPGRRFAAALAQVGSDQSNVAPEGQAVT